MPWRNLSHLSLIVALLVFAQAPLRPLFAQPEDWDADDHQESPLPVEEGLDEDILEALAIAEARPTRTEEDIRDLAVVVLSAPGTPPGVASLLSKTILRNLQEAKDTNAQNVPTISDTQLKNDGLLLNEGEQRLISAQRFFRQGMDFFTKGDLRRATEEFERALYFYRQGYPYIDDSSFYLEIAFYLAMTTRLAENSSTNVNLCNYAGLVLDITGRSTMLETIEEILGCDWTIDEEKINPLEIVSDPPGSLVYLNGQYQGITPTTLSGYRRGDHMITFVHEGYRRANRTVTLGQRFENVAELELGIILRPGVYSFLYRDLISVISIPGQPSQSGMKLLEQTAASLESKEVLLILLSPPPHARFKQGTIHTLQFSRSDQTMTRHEISHALEPEEVPTLAGMILEQHLGLNISPIPSQEELQPIYFKLSELPVQAVRQ